MRYTDWPRRPVAANGAGLAPLVALPLWLLCVLPIQGEPVPERSKHIIGATATITEVSTGLPFTARVDSGAKTCSIHVEKWEIKDPEKRPFRNIGKSIRFLVKNDEGKSEWIETLVAGRIRVRSSTQDDGDYHGRYKVRLTLQWQDVKKEVLVTLTDRAEMDYPLLVGRNFLRDDFLVDVDRDNHGDGDGESGEEVEAEEVE